MRDVVSRRRRRRARSPGARPMSLAIVVGSAVVVVDTGALGRHRDGLAAEVDDAAEVLAEHQPHLALGQRGVGVGVGPALHVLGHELSLVRGAGAVEHLGRGGGAGPGVGAGHHEAEGLHLALGLGRGAVDAAAVAHGEGDVGRLDLGAGLGAPEQVEDRLRRRPRRA